MKNRLLGFLLILLVSLPNTGKLHAQCSICTKTAQQLGEKPAKGLNSGIIYLAFAPFFIVGIVAFRWLKNNRDTPAH